MERRIVKTCINKKYEEKLVRRQAYNDIQTTKKWNQLITSMYGVKETNLILKAFNKGHKKTG